TGDYQRTGKQKGTRPRDEKVAVPFLHTCIPSGGNSLALSKQTDKIIYVGKTRGITSFFNATRLLQYLFSVCQSLSYNKLHWANTELRFKISRKLALAHPYMYTEPINGQFLRNIFLYILLDIGENRTVSYCRLFKNQKSLHLHNANHQFF